MDFKLNATVELKPADVERIVAAAVLKELPGYTVKRVQFEVQQEYDRMERPCGQSLSSVKVSIEAVKAHDGRGPG